MNALPSDLRRINFIVTNRCNLRCVYCPQGSHPDEYHADLTSEFFDEIYQFVRDHKIEEAAVGYYGEITMIEGWWQPIRRLLDLGVQMSATTNGSTVLSADEVATFARFKAIEWSIDTHDIQILKKVRKKVDARTIVHNFHLVRGHCLLHGLPVPDLRWTGVLTVTVAETLPEFVAYAASCGVKAINFNEVGVYDGAPVKGLNVVDQDDAVFEAAASRVEEAVELAKTLGIYMSVAELARIQARRAAIKRGEKFGVPLYKSSTPVADIYCHSEGTLLPPGHTRACRSPWEEFYLDPKGQVFACCMRGDVMGVAKTKADLEQIYSSEGYERLRRSLETGVDLDPACANCQIKQAVPIAAPKIEAAAPPPTRLSKLKRLLTGAH